MKKIVMILLFLGLISCTHTDQRIDGSNVTSLQNNSRNLASISPEFKDFLLSADQRLAKIERYKLPRIDERDLNNLNYLTNNIKRRANNIFKKLAPDISMDNPDILVRNYSDSISHPFWIDHTSKALGVLERWTNSDANFSTLNFKCLFLKNYKNRDLSSFLRDEFKGYDVYDSTFTNPEGVISYFQVQVTDFNTNWDAVFTNVSKLQKKIAASSKLKAVLLGCKDNHYERSFLVEDFN